MSRVRVAQVLAVLAALAVLVTAAVAVSRWRGRDEPPPSLAAPEAGSLLVRDPRTGASFTVPDPGWRVEDRDVRVYYTDDAGRPVAVARGPAVFRPGYCEVRPRGSSRAFAGFTRQDFAAWRGALGQTAGRSDARVRLADGTAARLRWARVDLAASGPCSAAQAYVAMVSAAGVRVVLVADTGVPGALPEERIEAILRSLRL